MITTVRKIIIGLLCVLFISISPLNAQDEPSGLIKTVSTAVPFLRIIPDARSGAMGDVGIGLSPDANATFFNAAKI
ncbi:MAG: hypothetical protein KDD32_06660, partial [Bacteroidetes bacterium]|nr:hypothetical protein [Bacteroidota bacterium]